MHFRSIQALRAIAALSVLLFHVAGGKGLGAAGVDVFFVISGFIMGTVGTSELPAAFFTKRLIRIVPLYWLTTLAMCLGSLIPGLFAHFSFDMASLTKSLLFIPYFDKTGHIWPLVVPGWTLDYEILFYVVFSIGLAVRNAVVVSSASIVLLVAAGAVLRPNGAVFATWTDPVMLEFVAGLTLSRIDAIRGVGLGIALFCLGAACFGVLFLLGGPESPRLVFWGGPALAMVAGAVALERAGRWPTMPVAERIGDASYSLYLLHGLVIPLVHKFVKHHILLEAVLVVAVSLVLALASWKYIERPAAKYLWQKFRFLGHRTRSLA